MGKINQFFSNPEYFITSPASRGYLDWMPDSVYIKILYRAKMGRKCNLKNPVHYNEKLQWLKLNDRNPQYQKMVDKYDVREYIIEKIGPQYLVENYGVYDTWEEINFDELPDQFVIKCTHDSGSVEICKDKKTWNKEEAKKRIKEGLARNYYKTYREWPYKNIKPRVIIEKYMIDSESQDLKDYKIMCFDGKAKLIELHGGRNTGGIHTQTFYNERWEMLDIKQKFWPTTDEPEEKPEMLERMLELSEQLSYGIKHLRVDWYVVDGKIYFGELTFYDGSGFVPFEDKDEEYLGSLIKL